MNISSTIVAFAYNFPHRKTAEGLVDLYLNNIDVDLVIAMDPVELDHNSSIIPVNIKGIDYRHPSNVSSKVGFSYEVAQHDSDKCLQLLSEVQADIGVVLGARILPKKVIDNFSKGIINIHPGLLPENRGLDAIKWAIYNDWKQGVSAHIISETIDSGRLIDKRVIDLFHNDTLITINRRLSHIGRRLMEDAIRELDRKKPEDFPILANGEYHSTMPPNKEIEVVKNLSSYLCRHAC